MLGTAFTNIMDGATGITPGTGPISEVIGTFLAIELTYVVILGTSGKIDVNYDGIGAMALVPLGLPANEQIFEGTWEISAPIERTCAGTTGTCGKTEEI
jgi:hypothetical protein